MKTREETKDLLRILLLETNTVILHRDDNLLVVTLDGDVELRRNLFPAVFQSI